MTVQKALVIIGGQIQQMPTGDTLAGAAASSTWKEPVSVFNAGAPEIVFDGTGDVVMNDAS